MKTKLYYLANNQSIEVDITDDNIKIIDSYLIKDDSIKKSCLEFILKSCFYIKSRTIQDMLYEWKVHNWCYKHNIKIDSTKDVDLELPQNLILKLMYKILGKTICRHE